MRTELISRRRPQVAAQVGAHGGAEATDERDVVLLHLPEAEQRVLEIVVGEVGAARSEPLQRDVGGDRGLRERGVEAAHVFGKRLRCDGRGRAGLGRGGPRQRAHELPHPLRVEAALLQDLGGQAGALSDRLVVGGRLRWGACPEVARSGRTYAPP